ncbi:MAG: [FeFe] hydrogenase H-cluster maturation GTPase HydF [bacterium]|nr:[FeFe] hydrogenase H-cluster maturation GTPase HydF [bacterium]MDD5354146.1 [FeFe] hydrogenase H-cluster maturation GTPase HydF [bacterium]MDD5755837.1 [FeFe] hydrogenase H-cluster maturation GTPase HydF [bacterium]
MKNTPKSLRLHIGIFGRTNVGKSSFLNLVAGQDVAIISPVPGTTTDVVEKTMELLPVGPVVFLDTAGIDDRSLLAELRIKKSHKIFDRADVILLIIEPDYWTEFEDEIITEAEHRGLPCIIIINKTDLKTPGAEFLNKVKEQSSRIILTASLGTARREATLTDLKKNLLEIVPDEFLNPLPLVGDLLKPGGLVILVVPIDLEAPKGRLILPQVQTIRDALDNDAAALVVKEREYASVLANLQNPPDLVVCDSQVVLKMAADTPPNIKCTTFSILFARQRSDLVEAARGVSTIKKLKAGDKVLIAEACSHHPVEDDIARVKIPRWLRQYVGGDLQIDVSAGHDFPENLREYKLIIHCGGCMINKRQMFSRIQQAQAQGVPITNYGLCISLVHGVLERVLEPFPAALKAYRQTVKK